MLGQHCPHNVSHRLQVYYFREQHRRTTEYYFSKLVCVMIPDNMLFSRVNDHNTDVLINIMEKSNLE